MSVVSVYESKEKYDDFFSYETCTRGINLELLFDFS